MYYETDMPAVVNGGKNCDNGGVFGGDWWGGIIGLIAVAAIFGGGFGNGGIFGGNRGSVGAEVQRGFDTSAIITKLDGINNGLCDGFYAMNTSIMQNGYETRSAISDLGYRLQDCCCTTQRAIDGVNYNLAKSTCDITNTINNTTRDIIDSQRDGTAAILNFLTQEKISSLQAENAALTAQLSQNAQTRTLIDTLRPCPQPAYITCSPYESVYGFNRGGYGNNCGCGCGCGSY